MGKKKNDTITTEKCINEIIENALNRITADIDNAFYSRDNNIIIAKMIKILYRIDMSICGFNDMVDLAKKNNLDIPDEIKAAAKNEKILGNIDYDKVKTISDEINSAEYETLNDKPYLSDRLYLADKLYLVNDYVCNTDTDYNTIHLDEIIIPLLESSFKNLSIVDLYAMSAEDIKSRIYDNITSDIKNDIQKALVNGYDEIYINHNHNVEIFLGQISEEYIDTLHNKIYQFLHDERIPISKAQLDMLPDVKQLPIILDILKYEVNLYESDPQIRKNNLYHLMEKYYKDTLEMYLYAIMLDIETNAIIDKFMYRSIQNDNSRALKKLHDLLKAILPEWEINNISLDSLIIKEGSSENDKSIIFNMRDAISGLKCKYKFKDYKSDDLILYSFLPAIITIFLSRYVVYDEYDLKVNNMPDIKRSGTYNLYKCSENNTILSDILTYIGLDECDIEKINHNLLPNREATNAYEKRVLENFSFPHKIDVDINDGYYTNAYIIYNLIEIYKNIYEAQKELISMHEIYTISDLFCFVLSKTNEMYPKQDDSLVAFYKLMATVILRHFSNFVFKNEPHWNLSEADQNYLTERLTHEGRTSKFKFKYENPYELFIFKLMHNHSKDGLGNSNYEDFYNDISGKKLSESISTEVFNDADKIRKSYCIIDSYKNFAYINPIEYKHFSDYKGKYNDYKQKFLDIFTKYFQTEEALNFNSEHNFENININKIDKVFTKKHKKLIRSVLLDLLKLNEYERNEQIWLHPDDRDDDSDF